MNESDPLDLSSNAISWSVGHSYATPYKVEHYYLRWPRKKIVGLRIRFVFVMIYDTYKIL